MNGLTTIHLVTENVITEVALVINQRLEVLLEIQVSDLLQVHRPYLSGSVWAVYNVRIMGQVIIFMTPPTPLKGV